MGKVLAAPLSNKYFNQLISKSREKQHKLMLSRFETMEFIRRNEKKESCPLWLYQRPISRMRPNLGALSA